MLFIVHDVGLCQRDYYYYFVKKDMEIDYLLLFGESMQKFWNNILPKLKIETCYKGRHKVTEKKFETYYDDKSLRAQRNSQ